MCIQVWLSYFPEAREVIFVFFSVRSNKRQCKNMSEFFFASIQTKIMYGNAEEEEEKEEKHTQIEPLANRDRKTSWHFFYSLRLTKWKMNFGASTNYKEKYNNKNKLV